MTLDLPRPGVQRRLSRLQLVVTPTVVGGISFVLSSTLALIGLRASNSWLLLIGCALFAPVLVSQVIRPGLDSISVNVVGPDRTVVGRPVEQLFQIHNQGRASTPAFRLSQVAEGFAPLEFAVPGLPPDGRAEVTVHRTPTKRTVSSEQELQLWTSAPFGMAMHRRRIRGRMPLIVHPAIGPVAPTTTAIAIGSGANGQPSRLGEQLHELRDWTRGDGLRHVHWRASAKRDRLIVAVPEVAARTRLAVILFGVSTDERWETLISTAAWTAAHTAGDRSGPVWLSAQGAPDQLSDDPVAILDWFAALRSVEPPSRHSLRTAFEWADSDGLVLLATTRPIPGDLLPAGRAVAILSPDGGVRSW